MTTMLRTFVLTIRTVPRVVTLLAFLFAVVFSAAHQVDISGGEGEFAVAAVVQSKVAPTPGLDISVFDDLDCAFGAFCHAPLMFLDSSPSFHGQVVADTRNPWRGRWVPGMTRDVVTPPPLFVRL